MKDQDKTKEQLIDELEELRQRVVGLEKAIEETQAAAALFQVIPLGIHECDTKGRITYVNPSQQAITGYTADELLGTFIWDRTPPGPEKDSQPAYLKRLVSEQPPPTPFFAKNLRKNGEVFEVRVDWNYKRNAQGQVTGFVSIVSDITEWKRTEDVLRKAHDDLERRAEAALRQSHNQLHTIYSGMVEGLLITNIATKQIRRVNPSFCRMLGYSEEELLMKSIPDLHPPEEVPNDLRRFLAAAEGLVSINEERPVVRRDGTIFYADITGHRILYEGEPCLLALFRDVTERMQAKAALEREHRTLRHMLQASDHERQLIAYDIHDGLAQQLAGAIMQFQIYDHQKDAKPLEARKAFEGGMALLRQGHFEARRLISGVRPPILDESGVVTAVAHLVNERSIEEGPKIKFHSKVDFHRLTPILENAIYRIVQEGLANACKHSKSPEIRISLLQRGNRVRIEVKDFGIGFDLKNVQENRYGLPGIRERARVLGGKCRIRTRPGKGTSVVVELPVMESEPAP